MKPMILLPFLLATAAPVLAQSQVDEPTPAGAQAQASPAFAPPVWGFEGSDVPVDPGYTYGVLPNGMRYILRENHQPAGTVLVRLRIGSGSLEEREEERGLAHYLEHMAFNGSKKVPEGEMIKLLEREGLGFGADTNASTGFEVTSYKLDLPRHNARDTKGVASRNITEHPLAGQMVTITLVATDGAGQTGRSEPVEMQLPSRNFNEPLAASVAEQRQIFALDTRQMPQAIAFNEAIVLRADETIPDLGNFIALESARAAGPAARGHAGEGAPPHGRALGWRAPARAARAGADSGARSGAARRTDVGSGRSGRGDL